MDILLKVQDFVYYNIPPGTPTVTRRPQIHPYPARDKLLQRSDILLRDVSDVVLPELQHEHVPIPQPARVLRDDMAIEGPYFHR